MWFLFLLFLLNIEFINCSTLFSISTHSTVYYNGGWPQGPIYYSDLRYRSSIFTCLPNDDCTFSCNGEGIVGTGGALNRKYEYCSSPPDPRFDLPYEYAYGECECSTITCANGGNGTGYNCNVNCCQQNSCFSNIINCGNNSTCNIDCGNTNACSRATFNCGNNSTCNIYCTNQQSCMKATFNCGDNSQCNIYCHGNKACESTKLNCGRNSECSIECNAYGQYSGGSGYECYSLDVNARNGKSLSIDVYNNLYSAKYMKVYAPSQTIIKCGIDTYNTSLTRYSCDHINIHSYRGWNNVQLQINWVTIDNVFQDYTLSNQRMYCGLNDEYFCFGYAQNGYLMQCHSDIAICNTYTLS